MKKGQSASNLRIVAGPSAYARIRQHGLSPADITAVFGASGAAKWLSIYGLDRAIFESWLAGSKQPLHLYGTSIGAWKLAAAMEKAPGAAFERLGDAYIRQTYDKKVLPSEVAEQAERIIKDYLSEAQMKEILDHPHWRLHIGTVRSKGWMASDEPWRLSVALVQAAMFNLQGRNSLTGLFDRVVFSSEAASLPLFQGDAYSTEVLGLTEENFRQVLLATASIPHVLPAVTRIEGASPGSYRDGGVLDYHPVPSLMTHFNGLVLYPHFYPFLIPGWFDKFFSSRKASGEMINNVVILAPSEAYVKKLPYGRISDRKDFLRFQGQDEERMRVWRICMEESLKLGEEFLQLAASGEISRQVELAY